MNMETNYLNGSTKNVNKAFVNDDFDVNYDDDMEVFNDNDEIFDSLSTVDTTDFINKIQSKVNLTEEKIRSFEEQDMKRNVSSSNSIDAIIRLHIKTVLEEEFMPIMKKMISEQLVIARSEQQKTNRKRTQLR